jgi:hypothetical protein
MKYQIRKIEQITMWQATEVAEVDPEAFKNLEENPYTGNSEEEFLTYIQEFINTCRYDGFPSDLDDEVATELDKMIENLNWTEYANSCENGETSWYQIGEKDEKYRKTGGFKINFDVAN